MTLNVRSWVSTRFFTFFVSWAVFQSYWGLWLANRGFSAVEIGSAVGCSLMSRAVTVALIYPVLNRHATLLRLSRVVPWLLTAAAVPYVFVAGFPTLVVVSVIFGLIYPIMLPLNETLATTAARQGLLPYGPTRSFGSAGFMAGTLAAGWFTATLGAGILVYVLIGACLLMALAGFVQPTAPAALAIRGSGTHGFAALARDRVFLACLLIAMLVQGSHAAYYSFGAIRFSEMVTPAAVPFLLVLAPLSEFALFTVARARFESLGYRTLFAIGAAAAALRWTTLALAGNWEVLAASQLLHAGSYATVQIAFAIYVRDRVDLDLQAAAQGLYASLAMGLATAALTWVAGIEVGASFAVALLTMAGVSLASLALLTWVRIDKRRAAS